MNELLQTPLTKKKKKKKNLSQLQREPWQSTASIPQPNCAQRDKNVRTLSSIYKLCQLNNPFSEIEQSMTNYCKLCKIIEFNLTNI